MTLPPGAQLCPGQPASNYCDCSSDCTNQPSWCACSDAQACCKKSTNLPKCAPDDDVAAAALSKSLNYSTIDGFTLKCSSPYFSHLYCNNTKMSSICSTTCARTATGAPCDPN